MAKTSTAIKDFLFVAHPGHELCVHGWLEIARPKVFVLTDGSGRSGQSRIQSTTRILREASAEPGSIFGPMTDAEIYRALLDHDFDVFLNITKDFTAELILEEVESVAGDAIEGFNPAHDVCRLIINAAVEIARRRTGRTIVNREFLLVGAHDTCPPELRAQAIWLQLSEDVFQRKLKMARAFDELRSEIDAAFHGDLQVLRHHAELSTNLTLQYNSLGVEAYRVECLRPADQNVSSYDFSNQPPFYERYGELRVAEGSYQHVIRYREHVQPIAEALQDFVEQNCSVARIQAAAI